MRTTDSRHNLMVYPNLARDLSLSNINQLWVADITYIRLLREFIYLAVLLDALLERAHEAFGFGVVIRIAGAVQADFNFAFLQDCHVISCGLLHALIGMMDQSWRNEARMQRHLQGSQSQLRVDVARDGPTNTTTIKEEIYMNDYETLAKVRASIEDFIEAVYNRKRLHLAIGYRPCCMWGALACGSCLMSQAKNSKGSDRRAAEHC